MAGVRSTRRGAQARLHRYREELPREEQSMEFVQVIEYQTSKPDEMAALAEEFLAQRAEVGGPAPSMVLVVGDRNRPNTYLTIVRFPSYEAAMENSQRDDTTQMAERFAALCDSPPTFRNLDVVVVGGLSQG